MIAFLQQVHGELGKVTFPAKEQVIRLTLLVIAISIIVGLYLGALDFLFLEGLRFLIG
jgi:preprotein translocase SecE subunit